MGQCISFNALGLVLKAKSRFRGHLCGFLSAYQKISMTSLFYVVFAQHGVWRAQNIATIKYRRYHEFFLCRFKWAVRSTWQHPLEEMNDEDVCERVVEVANKIGVTISKQDIIVCYRLSSRNTGSRPLIA